MKGNEFRKILDNIDYAINEQKELKNESVVKGLELAKNIIIETNKSFIDND